jgi:hypothetical protein
MNMKPMYALHKDSSGQILAAGSFSYDFEFSKFLRELDVRPGDSLHFGEAVKREAAEVAPAPEFVPIVPDVPDVPDKAPEFAEVDEDLPAVLRSN